MHRYDIEIDGRRFAVDVQDLPADRYQVSVEGRRFEVSLGAALELEAAPAAAAATAPSANLRPAPSSSQPAATAKPVAPAGGAASSVLRAPMPGAILRVAVVVGAQVQRGQDIAVLEAMKMENIIRAPHTGTITEVCVQAGQQLAHGDVIVRYLRSEEVVS